MYDWLRFRLLFNFPERDNFSRVSSCSRSCGRISALYSSDSSRVISPRSFKVPTRSGSEIPSFCSRVLMTNLIFLPLLFLPGSQDCRGEGGEQLLVPEYLDKPGVTSFQQGTVKKQGSVCKRSGMEASASKRECSGDEPLQVIFMSVKGS